MSVKVYERILDLFEKEGIRSIFGIPDPNFVHIFQLAQERGWSVVAPHHEQSGGFMAEAVTRMTGTAAVCIGDAGPGVANLAPAIMNAQSEHSPIIFIGGQRARITEQRVRRGRTQFVKQSHLFDQWVKYSASIEYAEQTDEIIHEALRAALSGTPGPVYIEYPSHVIQQELDVAPAPAPDTYRLVGQSAGSAEVAHAARLIRAASAPIILAGHGVHTARGGAGVKDLAEALQCPVIQTSGGTSFIPGLEDRTFPYGFSDSAIDAVVQSDLCIAVGTELGEPVHYGTGRHWAANDDERRWVYIEQDPRTIGINRPMDAPLVGDLRVVLPQLVDALDGHVRQRPAQLDRWIAAEAAEIKRVGEKAPTGGSRMHPAQLIVEATKAFPANGIMARDGGATTIFGWTYTQAKPHDVMWNQNLGHLGTGLPYAIGAGVADGGNRPIMLITGDSAFMFHLTELETAARLNLPLVCVVGVDYSWGLEVGVYKRTFGKGSNEAGVHWSTDTRLDLVAQGLGCYGEYVDDPADIGPAIERAFTSGKPGVIHVVVDPEANSEELPKYAEFSTWYAE